MPKRSLVVSMAVSAILLLAHQVMAVKVEIGNNKEFLVDGKLFFPVMQWLQDARGYQLVYYEDFHDSGDDRFLDRHSASSHPDPLDMLEEEGVRELLVQAIEALPERERLMMSLYYEKDLNLREIGEVMGVSESRICQIHTQAIARLRSMLREKE